MGVIGGNGNNALMLAVTCFFCSGQRIWVSLMLIHVGLACYCSCSFVVIVVVHSNIGSDDAFHETISLSNSLDCLGN